MPESPSPEPEPDALQNVHPDRDRVPSRLGQLAPASSGIFWTRCPKRRRRWAVNVFQVCIADMSPWPQDRFRCGTLILTLDVTGCNNKLFVGRTLFERQVALDRESFLDQHSSVDASLIQNGIPCKGREALGKKIVRPQVVIAHFASFPYCFQDSFRERGRPPELKMADCVGQP